MKKISTMLLVATLCAWTAMPEKAVGQQVVQSSADGVMTEWGGAPLEFTTLKATFGQSGFSVAYPVGQEAAVVDTIRAWENARLGATYQGSLADVGALFRHYATALTTIDEGYGESAQWSVVVSGESEGVVTLMSGAWYYGGGAHGVSTDVGATFRKVDGAQFGRSLLAHFDALRPLVARGLRSYFGTATDREMLQYLQLEALEPPTRVSQIPAPETLPWVEGDSVVFQYLPYEIACYAAGAPQARMSLGEVWPWLPQAWREVLRGGVLRAKESEDNAWRVGAMNVEE